MLSHGGSLDHDVIVVGGGVSGLAAAVALTDAGLDVVVFEATDRVGGRLRSFADGDARFDLGATWIWPNEPLVADLVQRLGVGTFPSHLGGVAVFDDGQSVRRLDHNPLDVESSRFAGGADSLTDGLADLLPDGTVRLASPVERVEAVDGGLAVSIGSATATAAHVILALPPALAAAALTFDPPLPADLHALASATPVWMGGSTKVVAVYDRPFWRDDGLAGAAMSYGGPLREIHDISTADGAGALFGFGPAGTPLDPDAIRAQLGRLFGPAAAAPRRLEIVDWSTVATTTPPGAHTLGNYRTYGHPRYQDPAMEGRLHWIATETATAHPGHIEGALESAHRAVTTIQNRTAA